MVAKINVGNSLYGALAYNGEKVNEGQGRLLLTHKIFDDGTGTFDIRRAAEDFTRYLPEQVRMVCHTPEAANVYRQVWNMWFAGTKAERMETTE